MGKICELPKSSSRLLTSSQIITSVYCVVKELIENALDSSSKNVEVKLEDFGLEKIEVKDNGTGIDKNDMQFVARSHFTSKITAYSDLEKVNTYGFRGEALGAICAVADLVIITKSSAETIGNTVNFSHDGQIISSKPFPCAQGTTVSVQNLFKNLPVRKQYYRSEKNKRDDLRKVEDILIAYGCIQNDVRFALYHNKNLIWQKPALASTKNALIHILGHSVADHLKYAEYNNEETQRQIQVFLPKLGPPLICSMNSSSKCIVSINRRPVRLKSIDKLLKECYNKSIQNSGKACYPICFISINAPLTEVDVNVEPNKTSVMLRHSEEILAQFSEMLQNFYSTEVCENNVLSSNNSMPNEGQKSNVSDFLNSLKVTCEEKLQQSKPAFIVESPVSTMKDAVNKNCSNIANNSSSQKSNYSSQKSNHSISKKDIMEVGTPKEPSRKKLKSSQKISKNDIDNHITTMKNFFSSEDKNCENKLPDISCNTIHNVPTVTIQRNPSNENNQCSEASKEGNSIDSGRITTFAVSTNLCSNTHSVNDNCVTSHKQQFPDSSISAVNVNEDILKRPALDIGDQNGDEWSRGVCPAGGLFQPVRVLQPKAINIPEINPENSSDVHNGKRKEIPVKKNSSFERKLTAFDIFCRSNRLEVAAQNPEFNNQKIAEVLYEEWNSLSAEKKAMFKNMLDREYPQEVKKKERLGKVVSQNLNKDNNGESSCKTHKKIKPKIKEKRIMYSFDQMKSFYPSQNSVKTLSEDLNLISSLAPGIWVCAMKEKLYILNTFRLQETIIYHRLLETFQFDFEPLDVPKNIYASHVGDEGMEVLTQLSNMEINSAGNISDERLIANGFNIRLTRGGNNEVSVELVGITKSMAFYGMPDLMELLLMIKNKGFSAKLSECRPGKIVLYLQSEANRMSRQCPALQRIQDVEDLLRQKPINCDKCIHHKAFFNELYNIVST